MKQTIAVASNPLIARFTDDLSFINPDQGERVMSLLVQAHGHPDYAKLTASGPIKASDDDDDVPVDDDQNFWPKADSWMARFRPYNVKDGILTIPVKGVLVSNFPYIFYGWITGYEYISKAMERGVADGAVKGIALDIDSPGGECKGNFDLVDTMFEQAKQKPVASFANDYAYSAAYNIGSVGSPFNMTRTGGVGSVGVVTSHMDMSKYLEDIGIKVTFIFAGKHKVDGNSYQPLTTDAKKRIQARIDTLYTVFVDSVARNRGMKSEAVRATEALTYSAEDAIEIGFADAVGPTKEAISNWAAKLNSSTGLPTMATFTQEQYDAAVAKAAKDATDAATAKAEADRNAAVAAASKAARDRMTSILALDEAKARPKAAMALVTDTDMNAEAAKVFLAKMPEEKSETAPPPKNALERAMDNTEQPNLGTTGGDKVKDKLSADEERVEDVKGILAAQAAVQGKKPDKKAA